MLKLFNSLNRKKQSFKPIQDKHVGMYTCGVTVYYSPHIGNMKKYVIDDILKRILVHNGYTVTQVENITDVGHLASDADTGEDKMKIAAEREHKSMKEIAELYTKIFLKDSELLNITKPDVMPKATEHIKEMLALLETLDKKGFLYKADNGIYFDTSKFEKYGKLTGMSFKKLNEQQKEGARVEKVEGKKHITDFAVWRFAHGDEKEMIWDSKFGRGFPGWHLECSAMSMKYLGNHFDIHTGGIDHLPIHHPNEIAQSEAATGEPLANYWIHYEFLIIDNAKMSKSIGNVYTVDDIMKKGYSPIALRLFYISGNYRQQQNFTFEALSNTQKTLDGMYSFLERTAENKNKQQNPDTPEFKKKIVLLKKEFFKALNDDINTPEALAKMHAIISETNSRNSLNRKEARTVIKAMLEIDEVLGLKFSEHVEFKKKPLDKEIKRLVDEREAARAAKDFKRSDEIRTLLKEKYNVVLEDTKDGVRWHSA